MKWKLQRSEKGEQFYRIGFSSLVGWEFKFDLFAFGWRIARLPEHWFVKGNRK